MNFNMITLTIDNKAPINVLGRKYYIDCVPRFSWSNSGLEFRACFDRFTVFFSDYTADQPCYVKISVDGVESKHCVSGKMPCAVLEGFKNTPHDVTIRRISEGDALLTIEKINLYGKEPQMLLPKPKKYNYRLEFLGDSITAGYGVTAPNTQTTYFTCEQDSTQSYAFLTAKKLNADIRTICISGQGIVHSCGEMVGIRMKEILKLKARDGSLYSNYDEYTPDVFIANVGTNDRKANMSDEEFINGANELFTEIRKMYPTSHIVWMYGAMEHAFEEQVRIASEQIKKNDKNFSLLIVKSVYGIPELYGTCSHPNANSSEKNAKLLAKHIQKELSKR